MAIFRGTGGSVSSSDSTIVDAVTAQATIATTKAGEASTSATTATTKASEASTSATTATTKASEANTSATTASTKATEATTAKTGAETAQTAAEAARDAALGHSNTANSSAVQTVAGSNTQVVGVYNNIANVNTVAGVNTDVTTVAGISSDVTTVAADASDIGTVSTNIANVNNVGNNIANVNAVHGNASNINTVAADGTDIGTIATNIANVNTVAGISSNVTTVAGLEAKMDTVIADASDIGAVAGNIGDVTTVAGINSDVDTVAGIAAKVTTVADNISDVQNADTNATNAASSASNASASATSASNSATTATTKATEASNSATAASNSATTATTKASQAAGSATTAGTSASTATTKASEASASASTATTKAGEAASSASAASGSASTAVTKASEASASAASAATSATNSSNAASTWNDFYTTYLGPADAPPTADVLGNALQTGAFYYDTGAGSNTVGLYVYNGSSWVYSTNYNNVTAPYSLSQDLATNSHDINFGDNAKANFGASDDLQIWHDGSNSRIKDSGTGDLFIQGSTNVQIEDASGANMIFATSGGSVKLFHNALPKLETTSTGIDVTGDVRIESTFPRLYLTDSNNNSDYSIINNNGQFGIYDDTNATYRMVIANTSGNVGIGTASPDDVGSSKTLHINDNTHGGAIRLSEGGTNNAFISYDHPTGMRIQSIDTIALKTANAERMRITSSGKVGIGTSSPDSSIVVESSGTNNQSLLKLNTDSGTRAFIGSDAQDDGYLYLYDSSDNLKTAFRTDGNASYIAGGGNVGIGTSSPDRKLHVSGSGSTIAAKVEATDGNQSSLDLKNSEGEFRIINNGGTLSVYDQTDNDERMRIDASGNLLVGKTATTFGTAGSVSYATGLLTATVDGNACVQLNRLTSDGVIQTFGKDGTTVGSIGTYSGLLTVGHGDVGLVFSEGGDSILPFNQTSNALRDAAINLGDSTRRFKDLYLSGGVHLGGTTAANKLDDYEEGTFTLNTASDSSGVFQDTPTCLYTKIGNTVNVFITFRVGTNFTSQNVGGLPFTTSHTGMNSSFISGGIAITSNNNTVSVTVGNNGTTIRFHDNQNTSDAHLPNTTDEYYRLNFTYKTA